MKKLIVLACLSLMFTAPTFAGSQQEKMKVCNMDANERVLQGDERKAFMKSCLSNKDKAKGVISDKKTTQPEKMKSCNDGVKEIVLHGIDPKQFMST